MIQDADVQTLEEYFRSKKSKKNEEPYNERTVYKLLSAVRVMRKMSLDRNEPDNDPYANNDDLYVLALRAKSVHDRVMREKRPSTANGYGLAAKLAMEYLLGIVGNDQAKKTVIEKAIKKYSELSSVAKSVVLTAKYVEKSEQAEKQQRIDEGIKNRNANKKYGKRKKPDEQMKTIELMNAEMRLNAVEEERDAEALTNLQRIDRYAKNMRATADHVLLSRSTIRDYRRNIVQFLYEFNKYLHSNPEIPDASKLILSPDLDEGRILSRAMKWEHAKRNVNFKLIDDPTFSSKISSFLDQVKVERFHTAKKFQTVVLKFLPLMTKKPSQRISIKETMDAWLTENKDHQTGPRRDRILKGIDWTGYPENIDRAFVKKTIKDAATAKVAYTWPLLVTNIEKMCANREAFGLDEQSRLLAVLYTAQVPRRSKDYTRMKVWYMGPDIAEEEEKTSQEENITNLAVCEETVNPNGNRTLNYYFRFCFYKNQRYHSCQKINITKRTLKVLIDYLKNKFEIVDDKTNREIFSEIHGKYIFEWEESAYNAIQNIENQEDREDDGNGEEKDLLDVDTSAGMKNYLQKFFDSESKRNGDRSVKKVYDEDTIQRILLQNIGKKNGIPFGINALRHLYATEIFRKVPPNQWKKQAYLMGTSIDMLAMNYMDVGDENYAVSQKWKKIGGRCEEDQNWKKRHKLLCDKAESKTKDFDQNIDVGEYLSLQENYYEEANEVIVQAAVNDAADNAVDAGAGAKENGNQTARRQSERIKLNQKKNNR